MTPTSDQIEITPPSITGRRTADWDISNAPRNYASLVLTQFGSALFAFACVWLISKKIGSEGYGGVVAIIAASQVAQILVNWTSYSVVRFGTEEFIETEKIARSFWLRMIVLVPNLLLVVVSSNLWFPTLSDWLKLPADSFWLIILHFTAAAFWIHVQFGLQGAKLPKVQGFLLMLERLLTLVGIGVLVALDLLSPLAALVSYTVAPILMMLAGTFILRSYLFSRFSIDMGHVRKIVAYSLPLLPFSLVGYFSGSYVDAIFVSNFLSIRDLGIYAVATQINGIALQLPTLANSLLLPLFITLQKESNDQRTNFYFLSTLPSLTLIWGLSCALLAFGANFGIPLIFGDEFREAIIPLWILLSASAISLPVFIGYSALSNANSTTYISMFAAIFSAIANITANMLLIPKYGLIGCAIATLIAYAVSVAVFAILLRRTAEMPVSWTFFAVLPNLCGTIILTSGQTPWLSFAVCITLSIFVAFVFRDAMRSTLSFMVNLKGA